MRLLANSLAAILLESTSPLCPQAIKIAGMTSPGELFNVPHSRIPMRIAKVVDDMTEVSCVGVGDGLELESNRVQHLGVGIAGQTYCC